MNAILQHMDGWDSNDKAYMLFKEACMHFKTCALFGYFPRFGRPVRHKKRLPQKAKQNATPTTTQHGSNAESKKLV